MCETQVEYGQQRPRLRFDRSGSARVPLTASTMFFMLRRTAGNMARTPACLCLFQQALRVLAASTASGGSERCAAGACEGAAARFPDREPWLDACSCYHYICSSLRHLPAPGGRDAGWPCSRGGGSTAYGARRSPEHSINRYCASRGEGPSASQPLAAASIRRRLHSHSEPCSAHLCLNSRTTSSKVQFAMPVVRSLAAAASFALALLAFASQRLTLMQCEPCCSNSSSAATVEAAAMAEQRPRHSC